jgi:hypothetical protein
MLATSPKMTAAYQIVLAKANLHFAATWAAVGVKLLSMSGVRFLLLFAGLFAATYSESIIGGHKRRASAALGAK